MADACMVILAIMVLAYSVRSVYIDSGSRFVRAASTCRQRGVARRANFSVSFLLFDYSSPDDHRWLPACTTGLLTEVLVTTCAIHPANERDSGVLRRVVTSSSGGETRHPESARRPFAS